MATVLATLVVSTPARPAYAFGGITTAVEAIKKMFQAMLQGSISGQFAYHRTWMMGYFLEQHVVKGFQLATEQLSAIAMLETLSIGQFIDAKQQMETQRLYQELAFEAHRDYQPSEDFCEFGTSVRSLAASERLSQLNTLALGKRQMSRQLGTVFAAGSTGVGEDYLNRWKQFVGVYCNPINRGWVESEKSPSGLSQACGKGNGDPERYNRDVDFTRLIENPRTLEVSFIDQSKHSEAPTPDEEDVIALGNNLYGHKPLTRVLNKGDFKNDTLKNHYLRLRSVVAKRNVAENSYNAIVGMKSEGSGSNYEFLAKILGGLGVPEPDLPDLLGKNPSYYAQLEVLAKRIYQSPTFFSNLYDTPANVMRKSVALRAIELMLDRAIYESQLRQEMTMSVLLSSQLRDRFVEARDNQK